METGVPHGDDDDDRKPSTSRTKKGPDDESSSVLPRNSDTAGSLSFGPGQPGALFQVKDEEVVDPGHVRPFLTLKYVEGLKYTLGNRFLGRGSQGEFIFFYPDDAKGSFFNYLTLECKDDGLWISTNRVEGLDPWAVVSVNGTPLGMDIGSPPKDNLTPGGEEESSTRLLFGDMITLSIGEEGKQQRQLHHFLFKAPSYPLNRAFVVLDEGHFKFGESRVLQNPLVVENILFFLPTTGQVKELRLLSKVWNTEGLKLLRNQVVLTPFELNAFSDFPDDLNQVSSFAYSQLDDLRFPHWKIIFAPGGRNGKRNQGGLEKEMKILDDLVWFFDPSIHTNNVKSLQLSGQLNSEKTLVMFKTILSGVKETLTSLDLKLDVFYMGTPPPFSQLPQLRSLSLALNSDGLHDPVDPTSYLPFLYRLLQIVGGGGSLKTLTIVGSGVLGRHTARIPFSNVVVKEMLKIQEGSTTPGNILFSSLSSLSLSIDDARFLRPLASLRLGGLRKLELRGMAGHGLSNLRLILTQHAERLEELVIHLNAKRHRGDLILLFPSRMSNLKNLSVFSYGYRSSFDLQFRVIFEGQFRGMALNYGDRFPALSHLTVWPVGKEGELKKSNEGAWSKFRQVISPFLLTTTDDEGRVIPAPSLRSVKVPFLLDGLYYNILNNLEATFPNVVFQPELNEARRVVPDPNIARRAIPRTPPAGRRP